MAARVRMDGTWPGKVLLRRGWSRAESRPWNDAVSMAHLRLVRGGGSSFISDCVEALCAAGADGVLSPPLPRSAQRTWRDAAFLPHAELALMRKRLGKLPPPGHIVVEAGDDDLGEILRIDAAAFDEFWRFDATALEEAIAATPRTVVQVVATAGGGLAGFAVTGAGATLAYLQRVAVDPASQGLGIGRSLVRSSARWAQRAGAAALMLNTPVGNDAAMRLYESEGFELLDEHLDVLVSS